MSKRKSKLKAMAAAGDPWAIETLRKARERGRAAAMRGRVRVGRLFRSCEVDDDTPPWETPRRVSTDSAFAEAMSAATDILEWRLGPNPPQWRIFRLAQALKDGG